MNIHKRKNFSIYKFLYCIFYILISVNVLSCSNIEKKYINKNELVLDINNNIDVLNNLISTLKNNFSNEYVKIENQKKLINDSIEYHDAFIDDLYKRMHLKLISVDFDNNIVIFIPKASITYEERYPKFYYSLDGKSHFEYIYKKLFKEDDINISSEKWIINLSVYKNQYNRHGWYIEKLNNNWYYTEQDYGYLRAIDYIKEDLIETGRYSEIIDFMKKPYNINKQ